MAGPGTPSLRSLAKEDKPHATGVVTIRLARYLLPQRRRVLAGIGWLLLSSSAVAATPARPSRRPQVAATPRR